MTLLVRTCPVVPALPIPATSPVRPADTLFRTLGLEARPLLLWLGPDGLRAALREAGWPVRGRRG